MELKPNIFNQQKQSMLMTSQVIQSIKLLQYGQAELQDFLRDQVERNPLVRIDSAAEPVRANTNARADTSAAANAEVGGAGAPASRSSANDGFGRRSLSGAGTGIGRNSGAEPRDLADYCAARLSLRDYLVPQIGVAINEPQLRFIATEIVESLDPDGYFRRDPEEIANMLGVDEALVLEALAEVQCFEPTGVGARDLGECLRLQLEDRGTLDTPMAVLLDNLDLLARYETARLARLCCVTAEDILVMAARIRELDPRPGRRFDADPVLPALPDVQLEIAPDGGMKVELNTAFLPRVLVDRQYYAEIRAVTKGPEDVRFVSDCLKNANWLARNVDQRAQTILRVATEIMKRQRGFFEKGLAELKPLYLRDIAEAVDLHETTICRATTDKYIMTPRGMFELKFFFTNSLGSTDGSEMLSSETVRQKIRQMIEGEHPTRILSDQALMDSLQRDGIDIARRTVAKYREMLGIPTSQQRRRLRKAEALARKSPRAGHGGGERQLARA